MTLQEGRQLVNHFMRTGALCCGLLATADPAFALEPIPTKDGFSGYLNVGGGSITGKSNMIAGSAIGDIGHRTISSLTDKPKSKSDAIPTINGELQYTFASSRTQLFFGNQLEDFIEFDFSTLLGVRHELSDKSIVAASFTFSALPTEVWKDPYLTNQKRSKTDRDSTGIQLEWDKISGTGFRAKYIYRNIEIDDELSGTSLGLSTGDIKLLERDGSSQNVELSYQFNFNNGHLLRPILKYRKQDLDGRAMRHDAWSLALNHIYATAKYTFVTNIEFARADFDKENPIYGKTLDYDTWGASLVAAYKNPFGAKKWSLLATAAYFDQGSNIDFYNTTLTYFGLSALYRF